MKRVGDYMAAYYGVFEPQRRRMAAFQDDEGNIILDNGFLGIWNPRTLQPGEAERGCCGRNCRQFAGIEGELLPAEVEVASPPLEKGQVVGAVGAGILG